MCENKKFLEGCERLDDGRLRIREKIQIAPIKSKDSVTEKIILEGKEILPKRKYTFLIWNNEFNGNGRNYKYVIPRVIKENRPTFTLADHPLDGEEADSVRICGCGKNYRIVDGWLACDWYPLGELGNKIADGFDLGVPSLVSSSVLGCLDDNGYVIDDDGFFLERICDIIIDFPSNGVFQYKDHMDSMGDGYKFTTISANGFSETLNKNLTILSNSDKKFVENKGENIMADNDELIQQSMILNIKSMIKDADNAESPFDKKETLVSAESFAKKLDDSSLHDEIVKKIEDVDDEIKKLSAKGLQTDDLAEKVNALNDENEKLKDEIEKLTDEKNKIERKFKTLTDMYDEEQYKASETELEKTEMLEKENKALKGKVGMLENRIKQNERIFEGKIKKIEADANTKVDAETVIEFKDKIEQLEDEVSKLKSRLKKSEIALKKANGDLSDANDELENVKKAKKISDAVDVEVGAEEIVALKEKINELTLRNSHLRKALNTLRTEKQSKSRFSTIRKQIEDEDDTTKVVNDDIIKSDINDNDIVVNEDGISVERNEDEIMEKMLKGEIK